MGILHLFWRQYADCVHDSRQSHRPSTRLEIVLVGIYDTPHNYRHNLQDVAYEDIHEGLQILYTR